jgi:translation initiation factor 4G
MHSCIVHLLKKPEEEEMECLCKLFEGTGKMLDRPEARQYMDKYFERMLALSRDKRFTSRVRFMIQDVIALRRGTWEPRMADNAPQTLNEIRRGG